LVEQRGPQLIRRCGDRSGFGHGAISLELRPGIGGALTPPVCARHLLRDPEHSRQRMPREMALLERQMDHAPKAAQRIQHRVARGARAVLRRREADHVGVSERSKVLPAEVRDELVVDETPVAIERRAANLGP
jgi:hypothetical protein